MNVTIEYDSKQINVPVINNKIVHTFRATTNKPPKILAVDGCEGNVNLSNLQLERGEKATSFVLPKITQGEPTGLIKDAKEKPSSKNLLYDSDTPTTTSAYLVRTYEMTEDIVAGDKYTFALKGSLLESQKFDLWQNGGSTAKGHLSIVKEDLYALTFVASQTTSGNERKLTIYQPPNNSLGEANIEWATLVKGSIPLLDWVPSPEDVQRRIDEAKARAESAQNTATAAEDIANETGGILSELSAREFVQKEQYYLDLLDKINEDIENANVRIGPIETTTENVSSNFTFGESGLTIGRYDMDSKLNLSNDRISFISGRTTEGASDTTYITENTFYAHNMVVRDTITMINHTISNYDNKTVFRYVEERGG